jgi:hypothetical protein
VANLALRARLDVTADLPALKAAAETERVVPAAVGGPIDGTLARGSTRPRRGLQLVGICIFAERSRATTTAGLTVGPNGRETRHEYCS